MNILELIITYGSFLFISGKLGIFKEPTGESVALENKNNIKGKNIIVTGANTGIGFDTARVLYKYGANVIICCRNETKAKEAKERILNNRENDIGLGGSIDIILVDLASFKSIRNFSLELKKKNIKIDVLVNNAGMLSKTYNETEDGVELVYGVNYLGTVRLTNLVKPFLNLKSTSPARVIFLSSHGHKFMLGKGKSPLDNFPCIRDQYQAFRVYGQSKLAIILISKIFGKEDYSKNIRYYNVHPGLIATELALERGDGFLAKLERFGHIFYRALAAPLLKTIEEGSATTIYCVSSDKCENETGLYYSECRVDPPAEAASDMELAKELNKNTEKKLREVLSS